MTHALYHTVQVYGVIGNPVSHSRSPALHNAAMRAGGLDAVYLPLLVDDLPPFLAAFPDASGFSVTIPHKVSLLSNAHASLLPGHHASLTVECSRAPAQL